ncbi:MAG: helix-turn-helix domain-containing protein [Castellaniella sp.]
MRERLDCAVFDLDATPNPLLPPPGIHANGRLHLHRMSPARGSCGDVSVLAAACLALRRFDVCLLGVGQANLPHVRQVLMAARHRVQTPIMGLLDALKAPAINDLYHLGMADFVREPCCLEELRVRAERMLARHRTAATAPSPGGVGEAAVQYGQGCGVDDSLHSGLKASMSAAAAHYAAADIAYAEVKRNIVAQFERAYLQASLERSSGNITQAARAAGKHRRAYWALMRKHAIDPEPFRETLGGMGAPWTAT